MNGKPADILLVHSDGALYTTYPGPGHKPAGWAYHIRELTDLDWEPDHILTRGGCYLTGSTTVELLAATNALEFILNELGPQNIELRTDCSYVGHVAHRLTELQQTNCQNVKHKLLHRRFVTAALKHKRFHWSYVCQSVELSLCHSNARRAMREALGRNGHNGRTHHS